MADASARHCGFPDLRHDREVDEKTAGRPAKPETSQRVRRVYAQN